MTHGGRWPQFEPSGKIGEASALRLIGRKWVTALERPNHVRFFPHRDYLCNAGDAAAESRSGKRLGTSVTLLNLSGGCGDFRNTTLESL